MIACESMMSKGYGSLVLNFLRIVGGLCDRGGGKYFLDKWVTHWVEEGE
jgi:hypothetical protein